MKEFIDAAYKKITSIYNNGKGGDKFIIHLIRSFLPINEWNRYLSTDKICCITGKRGLDIDYMSKKSIERVTLPFQEDRESLQKLQDEIRKFFDIEKDENIMQTRQMYYSEKSDKVLSAPAIIALLEFAQDQILRGDKKICFAVKEEQFKTVQEVNEADARAVAKKSAGFKLNEFEVDAFKELQTKFKK